MNCKYCKRALPEDQGKRPREYCNNACKQRAYRRRHPVDTRKELVAAKRRIAELERQLKVSPPKEEIFPVVLREFANSHGVAWTDVERVMNIGALRPITIRGELCLDAQGQRAFWQLNHDYGPMWRACPDCPHET